jgi:hypothetical protein
MSDGVSEPYKILSRAFRNGVVVKLLSPVLRFRAYIGKEAAVILTAIAIAHFYADCRVPKIDLDPSGFHSIESKLRFPFGQQEVSSGPDLLRTDA